MPIYEYKCTTCNHIEEELLPITGQPDKMKCPKCKTWTSKKCFSGTTNIIFKGDLIW